MPNEIDEDEANFMHRVVLPGGLPMVRYGHPSALQFPLMAADGALFATIAQKLKQR